MGEVSFYAPTDWLDILEDPNDEEAAYERLQEVARLSFPDHAQDVRNSIVEGVMNTRRIFLADGMLSCGLVAVPETQGGPAAWMICSGVVEVGEVDPDFSIGSIFARYFGQELAGKDVYLEDFPTAIGSGVGLISTPHVFEDGTVSPFPELTSADSGGPAPRTTIGMAVGLAVPQGGGRSLLIVGHCIDARQVHELACVIALMVSRSTIQVYGQEKPPQGTE